jgi:hypothetical protein
MRSVSSAEAGGSENSGPANTKARRNKAKRKRRVLKMASPIVRKY